MNGEAFSGTPCEPLAWDSEFFGLPIARVQGQRLHAALAEEIDRWCIEHGIACLYFAGGADDAETSLTAEQRGFHLVDLRITLDRKLEPSDREAHGALPARAWREEDLPVLESMARENHRDTRFHYDAHFSPRLADDLYARWIRVSCEGYADAVLVVGEGSAEGYITCHLDRRSPSGSIGLVGVGPQARGRGMGRSLVLRSLEWFAARQVEQVRVVTQGRNIAAQRLYQSCGFLTCAVQLYYHKWYVRPETIQ